MPTRFLLPLLLLLSLFSIGHAQNFQWAKQLGGTSGDRVLGITRDAQGNVIVCGEFSNTVDFNPGPGVNTLTSAGQTDVFVMKLDAVGNFLWVSQLSSTYYDYVSAVEVDANGNPVVVGYFYNPLDCDPGPGTTILTSFGLSDIYVVKLNPNGGLLWAKQMGGSDSESALDVAIDASGSIYSTGHFISTCDFDPGTGFANITATGTIRDVFISKLDANGGYVWAKKMGGAWGDEGHSIAVTSTNEVVVAGQFEGTADFDPGAGTYNLVTIGYQPDPFVAKVDVNGNFLWAKGFGNSQGEGSRSLALDASNNVYLAGNFGSTVDFDPGAGTANLTANGSYDLFLLKLSSAGNYVWAKQVGGSGYQEFERGLSVTNNSLWMTGYFNGTIDVNPGAPTVNLNSVGTQDGFLLNLDLNGAYLSSKQWGASGCTFNNRGLLADNAGNLYMGGYFTDTVDINPGAGVLTFAASSSSDGFAMKFSTCTATSSTQSATACGSFTLGGNTYTSSGSYQSTIPNRMGCDSVITLNLTIRQPSTSTINANTCQPSYTLNGQTYTQTGTYVQTLTNTQGCDSTITLNLNLNQASTATINASTCTGTYTLNGQTYTQGGTYIQHLTNVSGCDSAITLNLTLGFSNSASITVSNCGPYTLNGQTYNSSGSYTQVLTNVSGCDSTLTLFLTVNQPSSSSLTVTHCGPYTLNGQTYSQSGTYMQSFTNSQGCDSTLTLQLTVTQPSSSTITQSGCDSYTLNGQTYTQGGTYTQVLTNSVGCDSTITLQLTLGHSSTGSLVVNACDSYTLNGQTYNQSGTFQQVLVNQSGCDSTLSLILTLGTSPVATASISGQTLTASPSGMAYQWIVCPSGQPIPSATGISFTPSSNGDYAVIVSNGDCADTSACISVLVGRPDPYAPAIRVFPNPTSGACMLSWDIDLENAQLEVLNALGQRVAYLEIPAAARFQPLHLDGAAGIYYLRLSWQGGNKTLPVELR